MQCVAQSVSLRPALGCPSSSKKLQKNHYSTTREMKLSSPGRFTPASAVSYFDDQNLGHHGHGRRGPSVPAREMSEEEKAKWVESEKERIRLQTEQRSVKLKNQAHVEHLNHELKFGKLMMSQGSIDSAVSHFDKVIAGSSPDSYHKCEATLQKAVCLEKQGRESEAHELYQSLIRFRAPYPDIKRRAAQALFGSAKEGPDAPSYDDHMYRMFLSGFGSYMPKEKYVQTKEEKALLNFVPWAILLTAPLLLIGLLLFPH